MPEQDFIPKDDMDFDLWLHNFLARVEHHPTHFGLTPADLAELRDSTKSWDAGFDAHLKAQIKLRASGQKLKDSEQKYRDIIRAYNDAVQDSGAGQTYKSELQAYNDALQNRPLGLSPMSLPPMPLPPAGWPSGPPAGWPSGPPMLDMPLPPAGWPSGPPAQEGEEWKGGGGQ